MGRLRLQELEWAAHLSLQACILPLPQTLALANYARILNQVRPCLSRHLKAKAGSDLKRAGFMSVEEDV